MMISTLFLFISLMLPLGNGNDEFQQFVDKCKMEMNFDMTRKLGNGEKCVTQRISKLSYTTSSIYDLVCGEKHSLTKCLEDIQQGITICKGDQAAIGYSYNALKAGIHYLCQTNQMNNVALQCLESKIPSMQKCYPQGFQFTEVSHSAKMCHAEGGAADCVIQKLQECKIAKEQVKRAYALAFRATKCSPDIEKIFPYIFQDEQPASYELTKSTQDGSTSHTPNWYCVFFILLFSTFVNM